MWVRKYSPSKLETLHMQEDIKWLIFKSYSKICLIFFYGVWFPQEKAKAAGQNNCPLKVQLSISSV